MVLRTFFALSLLGTVLSAQPKRVLYITHSAGFKHDSIAASAEAMKSIASASGKLDITFSEDVSLLTAATLRNYDAIFFFTSGELLISDSQKRDLLDFVRAGHGFGGAHSATDTFYSWPEYGELIGAYFNGHPWAQEVKIDAEDPVHPASSAGAPWFTIQEEIYQFRNFNRANSRVLLRLDPSSVDLNAPEVNRNTVDFPLAWVRPFGTGRVFYTALGHFDATWRNQRFQSMLRGALLWLTGQEEGDATPRALRGPVIAGSGNAASVVPRNTVSPGAIMSLFGVNLTTGATAATPLREPPQSLAGTSLTVNGDPVPLFFASPTQVNAYVPLSLSQRVCITTPCPAVVANLRTADGAVETWWNFAATTPGLFTATVAGNNLTLWMTGLGAVERRAGLDWTTTQPSVILGGVPARVLFSGLAPGWLGLYQVNVELPAGLTLPARLEFRIGDGSLSGMIGN